MHELQALRDQAMRRPETQQSFQRLRGEGERGT
jgi:hypothetical protein